jgi:hypothetical protein
MCIHIHQLYISVVIVATNQNTIMEVKYVELEKKDGTRSHVPDGSDVDEERAALNDGRRQQDCWNSFFGRPAAGGGGRTNLGRVFIYTPPGPAGIKEWIRKQPDDPLVENIMYG